MNKKVKITRKRPVWKDILSEYMGFITFLGIALFIGINVPIAIHLSDKTLCDIICTCGMLILIEVFGLALIAMIVFVVSDCIYTKYHETKAILDFAKIPLTLIEREALGLLDDLEYLFYIQNTVHYKKFLIKDEYEIAKVFTKYEHILVELYENDNDIHKLVDDIMDTLGAPYHSKTDIISIIRYNRLDDYVEKLKKDEFKKANQETEGNESGNKELKKKKKENNK